MLDLPEKIAMADNPSLQFGLALLIGAGIGYGVFVLADFSDGRPRIMGLLLGTSLQLVGLLLFFPAIRLSEM